MTSEIRNAINLDWTPEEVIEWYFEQDPSKMKVDETLQLLEGALQKTILSSDRLNQAKIKTAKASLLIKNLTSVPQAIQKLNEASAVFEEYLDYEFLAKVNHWFGWSHFLLKDQHTRLKYCIKAVDYARKSENKTDLDIYSLNAADSYTMLNDYPKAEEILSETIERSDIAIAWLTMAKIKYHRNEFDEARKLIQTSNEKQIQNDKNKDRYDCSSMQLQALIEFKEGNEDAAIVLLNQALDIANKNNLLDKRADIYNLLSEIYEKKNDFKSAYNNLNKYLEVKKIHSIEDTKMTILEIEYENRLKDLNDAFYEVQSEKDKLRQNNQNLENFAHVASHDMKEPLRMISSFSQLLTRKIQSSLGTDEKEYLEYITQAASNLNTLVVDILDYAKLTSMVPEFESVKLDEIFKQIKKDYQLKIEEASAIITIGNLPAIEGQASALQRLFQNLISNALKFVPADQKPEVEIESSIKNDHCLVSVKDNGIGISGENNNKIFNMFQRLNAKNDFPGSGIGLAACLHIVKMHNGKIWVESDVGQGATFFVELPLKQQE